MFRLGTRGSELALFQANFVKNVLESQASVSIQIQIIRTLGDQKTELPFHQMNAQGVFTKELEEALLSKKIDLAVHSLKDLATESPKELMIGAIPTRAAVHDLLLVHPESLESPENRQYPWIFKKNAIVGTSALRRASLLLSFRPDVQIKPIRGNVPTRLKKLETRECDAILLAQAGIDRLQLDITPYETCPLNPTYFPSAPGQGALAIQIHRDNTGLAELLKSIHDPQTAELVLAERSFLALFEGGCSLPLGAFAKKTSDGIQLYGFLEKNQKKILDHVIAETSESAAQQLYEKFLTQLNSRL